MPRKKKLYKVVAYCTYRDGSRSYVVERGLTKPEANKVLKERCYTTVSRTFSIEEDE